MRDNRDPEAIGQALMQERRITPKKSACALVDEILSSDFIRNYGESVEEFEVRVASSSNNGYYKAA